MLFEETAKRGHFLTRNQSWPTVICRKISPPFTGIAIFRRVSQTLKLSMIAPLSHIKGKKVLQAKL